MNPFLLVALPDSLAFLEPALAWCGAHAELVAPAAVALGMGLLALAVLVLRRPQDLPPAATPAETAAARVAAAPAARVALPVPTPPAQAPAALEPAEPSTAADAVARLPIPEPEPEAPPLAPEAAPPAPEPGLRPAAPSSLRERLARTSDTLVGRLGRMLRGRPVDDDVLEELEALLLSADLGVPTAESLLRTLRKEAAGRDADTLRSVLREAIRAKLKRAEPTPGGVLATVAHPHVVLVLGVNGSGKTTTVGKLAARYVADGKRVILGAADTFRAAAIEQLEIWAERVDCQVVRGSDGGDPAAVAYDTVKAAVARGADVALVDTAGRLQTKLPLIEQLKKVARVVGKDLPGAPHEVLLVLDANTGQNAISQARIFTEAVGVTGLILTKLDGTAKGGVIIGLADEFGIPVKFVGVGEGIEDLREFHADEFVDALFEGA